MGDEWENGPEPEANGSGTDDFEKRLEEIRRMVIQGTSEAQQRLKRVVDKAGSYWQQSNTPPQPRQASTSEEDRIRQLANSWSLGNWQLARDLGTYMDILSWSTDEVWEVTVQTRWEMRKMEVTAEPYTGRPIGRVQPLLPVWDYELPAVTGLKAPETRTPVEGLDEVVSCTACNSTGRLLCATCTGRGWIICPDCKGRTKIRCSTCHGRGYVADWYQAKKKPFFQKQADNLTNSVTEKVSSMFEGIRDSGVPIPNPVDADPATKGRTVPCPDCVNGEVDCTCGTGKRVCPTCEGAKTEHCTNCGGTGKIVRQRNILRSFDLGVRSQVVGSSSIPEQFLQRATGDLIYNAEVNETLYPEAPPEAVPLDVWRVAVQLTRDAVANPQAQSRATLQVLELVRIPYTKVDYRFADQDYTFYIYDVEGNEKFYADRFPARWDRVERLVRSITADLMAPAQQESTQANPASNQARGYRVPIEKPPYSITEEGND
jgi:hypothetical protein